MGAGGEGKGAPDRRAEPRARARRRLVGIGLGAVAGAVTIVLIAGLLRADRDASRPGRSLLPEGRDLPEQAEFDLNTAARDAGCRLATTAGAPPADHTEDPDERIEYSSNPPTSGRHFVVPAGDGAYETAPTDEQLVHALEHGRIIVWFKPDLSEHGRTDLKAMFDEDSFQMLLVPRRGMPYQVAASAWTGRPRPRGQAIC